MAAGARRGGRTATSCLGFMGGVTSSLHPLGMWGSGSPRDSLPHAQGLLLQRSPPAVTRVSATGPGAACAPRTPAPSFPCHPPRLSLCCTSGRGSGWHEGGVFVCGCIRVCVHPSVCASLCVRICVHVCIPMCLCAAVCVCVCICVYQHVCIRVYMHHCVHPCVRAFVCGCVHPWVSMYMHWRVCVHVCSHACASLHVCVSGCVCLHVRVSACASTCASVCIHVHICLYMHTRVYTRVRMHVHSCLSVCTHVCLHLCVCMQLHACMCAPTCMHACVRVSMCTHVCVYVCVHMCARVYSAGGSLVRFIGVLFFLRHYRVLDDITQILKQHVPAGPARRYAAPGSPLPRPKLRWSERDPPGRPAAAPGQPEPSRPGARRRGGNADTRSWTRSLDEVISAGTLRGN